MLLLRVGTREDLEGRCAFSVPRRAAGLAHEGGKFSHQGAKAVHRGVVIEAVAGDLGQRGLGALGWRDRVACGLGLLVGIGKHQFAPGRV